MGYKPIEWLPGQAPGVSHTNLNRIERGIFEAYYQSEKVLLRNGYAEFTYTQEGFIDLVTEKVDEIVVRTHQMGYTNGSMASVRVKVYNIDTQVLILDYIDHFVELPNKIQREVLFYELD